MGGTTSGSKGSKNETVSSCVEVGQSCRVTRLVLSVFSKPCYGSVGGAWLHSESPQARRRVAELWEEAARLFLLSGGSRITFFHPSLLLDGL